MDKLIEEISIEKDYIKKTIKLLDEALNRSKKSAIEISAIASFLHHRYTGMENILKRILKFKKVRIPSSASSHKDLLNVVVDENVITQNLSEKLEVSWLSTFFRSCLWDFIGGRRITTTC